MEQRAELLAAIEPHLPALRKYSFGKHIAHKAEALLLARRKEQQGQDVQQGAGVEGERAPAPGGGEAAEAEAPAKGAGVGAGPSSSSSDHAGEAAVH